MTREEEFPELLQRLSRIHGLRMPAERNALRLSLDRHLPSNGALQWTEEALLKVGDRVGPWDIRRREDGRVEWSVRGDLGIRERHCWSVRALTSARAGTDCVRVLLIGESAAGSFGYWGEYSLARVLERKLRAACPAAGFEVIDLTCVNAQWEDCLAILHHGISLDPDVAVIYCGNNQAKSLSQKLAQGRLRHLPSARRARWGFQGDLLAGAVLALNACLEENVRECAGATVELCRAFSVEPIFVVPEYNLRDWRGPERLPFHLGAQALLQWIDLVRRGEAALAAGGADAERCFRLAVELDGGGCQRSFWGLGRALEARAWDARDARDALSRARDAGLGPFFGGVPQITGGVVRALRSTIDALAVPYVDLPEILAGACPGGTPDRSVFIDYCHLSAKGIELLGDALSRRILDRTAAGRRHAAGAPPTIEASPRDEALGCLVAAIHNYHYGQPGEIVRYWLDRCITLWPEARPALSFVAEHACEHFRERHTPASLGRLGLPALLGERCFYFLTKYLYHARFDHDLSAMIHDALGLERQRLAQTVRAQTAGLLDDLGGDLGSLFFLDRLQGFAPRGRKANRSGWERPGSDIRVRDFESALDVPVEEAADRELVLELLVPSDLAGTHVTLVVGGAPAGVYALQAGWQCLKMPIPADRLLPGINTLMLRWERLACLADRAEAHLRQDLVDEIGPYPVGPRLLAMSIRRHNHS